MKILQITAGAAGMYCGSCLRDNALAAELMAQGHDITLVPLYTPTLTDESNVSQERVFFGGISVYLQQQSAFFRHAPKFLDRLWDSKLALKAASRSSIPTNPRLLGELTVSMLKGEDGYQRKELEKLLDWLRAGSPPDLVALPNSLLIGLAGPIREALKRPVSCTLQGEDLFLEGLTEPYRSQSLELIRDNVKHVDLFVAVSEYYRMFMQRYLNIPPEKIAVVPLGINFEGCFMPGPTSRDQFVIGYFARVAPEKSLHILCEAYRRLRLRGDLPACRLEAAGYLAPEHKAYLDKIAKQMKQWGLAEEFHYRGVLDRQQKIDFLHTLNVLSVPSSYAEPKGLYLLEAMANGIPVVQPRVGAFPEIIEKTSGGMLVEPNNIDSLADGLRTIMKDHSLARQLGRNGYEGVRRHYSATQMASRTLEVYSRLQQPSAVSVH